MNITKIKLSQERVYIEYSVARNADNVDHYTLDSVDPPLPAFRAKLLELRPFVCAICELPAEFVEGLKVTGVTFSWTEKIMGAVLTAYKYVDLGGFVLNTPHLASAPYAQNATNPKMSPEMLAILQAILDEAHKYIKGERAQLEIFQKPPVTAKRKKSAAA